MHVSWGAYEVNLVLSLAALAFALLWLIAWLRIRCSYMLLLAAGWSGLCVYWGLIAVSAGPAPFLDRGDIAPIVRSVGLVSMGIMALGKAALLRAARKYRAVD